MKALIKSEMSADLTDELEEILPRLKLKYRQEFKDGGRDLPNQDELPIEQPIETVSVPPEAPAPTVDEPPAPLEAPAVAVETTPDQPQPETKDEAALALQRQIEELKRSEEIQRQQAAIVQLANERRQAWLAQTPGAKDHIPALGHIHRAALDGGLVDTSPEYFRFMESQLAALQAQQPEANPVMQPTPKFFQPPPSPAPPKEANFVSAPVSRSVPSSDGTRPRGKVTLSLAEQEAARMSNLTLQEYAAEKIKYQAMLRDGSYRDNRDERR